MALDDFSGAEYSATARNAITGETRPVRMSGEEIHDVLFDVEMDTCAGPCECTLEPDGTCPHGWPSRLRALDLV